MAVRLTVVMVHSPPAIAGAQQLAESAVGEMIGRPGIDLTLIGSLDQIAEASTDALTLESITGDVAVLDWRTPQQLIDQLASIGFHGSRARHGNDMEAEPAVQGTRKIYAFDLKEIDDAKQLCKSVQDLLATRQVKTVSIAGPSIAGKPNQASMPLISTAVSKGTSAAKAGPVAIQAPAAPATPESLPKPAAQSPELQAAKPRQANQATNQPTIDLDDLVDQLDQLDP